ncbi:hypothetical protein V8E55_007886 [Tylopilus felleus]
MSIPLRSNIHFATLCWAAILNGWNDGSNGPLLPRMQQVYHGYIAGSLSNMFPTEKIGFGKILEIGNPRHIWNRSDSLIYPSAAVPFPAFLFAYAINGYGIALQAAQNVGCVVRFRNNPGLRMGLLMGGAGALLSPLSATYFTQAPHRSYHYFTCLVSQIGITDTEKGTSTKSPFRQIMVLKDVHLLAVLILCYVDVEATLGGWIVTYIIDVRHGGSSSGYISTGVWTGQTVGRVAFHRVNKLIGEPQVLLVYAPLAIGFEFIAGSAVIPFVTGAIVQKRVGMRALHLVLVTLFVVMTVLWMMVSRAKTP